MYLTYMVMASHLFTTHVRFIAERQAGKLWIPIFIMTTLNNQTQI